MGWMRGELRPPTLAIASESNVSDPLGVSNNPYS
jgi:hypothetical protein